MVEKSQTAGLWPSLYEPFRQMGTRMAEWFAPATDAAANDDAYSITLELPGVAEKDIELSVHDDVITVKGEKSEKREERGETWFFTERQYGAFSRSFRLPADADGDKVSASLKDGVLEMMIPRRANVESTGRKIEIGRG